MRISLLVLSCLSVTLAITPGFPYGKQKVRGVNLGGWLVLEVISSGNILVHSIFTRYFASLGSHLACLIPQETVAL